MRTLRPCAAPVEKLHVQVPGLPFQDRIDPDGVCMLCLERLLRDEADHAELAERRCRMFRIRKEKLYGVTRGIGELRDDARDLIERRKLQRDRIAPVPWLGIGLGNSAP